MLFVRVKRSAARINDMVELSRLASAGSQCPLAEGVLRMHPCAALHGLDGRCARRIQNSAQVDIMRTSIIAVIRLARIFIVPWNFAEHVVVVMTCSGLVAVLKRGYGPALRKAASSAL